MKAAAIRYDGAGAVKVRGHPPSRARIFVRPRRTAAYRRIRPLAPLYNRRVADAFQRFLLAFPDYRSTESLDAIRTAEYARLDEGHHIYLDYTGAGLYAASQVRQHVEWLLSGVFGNPHSGSPASAAATSIVEETRRAVLAWFNATGDYVAIFTPNATAALKLVAESYPFAPGGRLLLTVDNHNSVNGIREFASRRGAAVEYADLTFPELRLNRADVDARLAHHGPNAPKLFAFPAQSNFSGVRHPLDLVAKAKSMGWDVLLDAAAFVATSRLDLGAMQPDFVCVSFYKMFGYPTGVGCLLARRDALTRLERPWFAGGTVNFATVQARAHLLSQGEAGFEDGTLNFASIPAVAIGLRHLEHTGMDRIATRVRCLTGWLLQELLALRHANGRSLVRLYGPATTAMRGGIVTMNFYDPEGHLLDYRRIEELAGEQRISLRTGCFCNPGAGETAEHITEDDILAALDESGDMSLPRFLQFITHRGEKSAGAIRVSVGLASNFADVDRFLAFAASMRDQARLAIGETTFDIASCRIIRDGS
jgi:molybdenum cofactor sulfurtransferase